MKRSLSILLQHDSAQTKQGCERSGGTIISPPYNGIPNGYSEGYAQSCDCHFASVNAEELNSCLEEFIKNTVGKHDMSAPNRIPIKASFEISFLLLGWVDWGNEEVELI